MKNAITSGGFALVDANGQPIHEGDMVSDFRGDMLVVTGGCAPRHSASTGRVWTSRGKFFPGVINAKWISSYYYVQGCIEDGEGNVRRAEAGEAPQFFSVYERCDDGTSICMDDFDTASEAHAFIVESDFCKR